MKNKLLIFTGLIILLFLIGVNQNTISLIVTRSFNNWLTFILPSIFPSAIIGTLLTQCQVYTLLDNKLNDIINKLYHLSGPTLYILIISYICGTPTNIIIIKELYLHKNINKDIANKYIALFFFNNPLFIYNMVNLLFNNLLITLIFMLLPLLNSFIIAQFVKIENNNTIMPIITNKISINKIITNSFNIMLNILAITIIMGIIAAMIPGNNILVYGLLEITNGLALLINKPNIILALIILSFGGISIHMQIKSVIADTNLSYNYFLFSRLFCTLSIGIISQISFFFR